MLNCSYELNGKSLSKFVCGAQSFEAFSGNGKHKNKPASVCVPNDGPIPRGKYYIVDRQSGGKLGWLYDSFNGKDKWFALYAADNKIDDNMFCNKVRRGEFRLHPKGTLGISLGCITIEKKSDYDKVYKLLKATKKEKIPGTKLATYGIVIVK